MAPARFTRLLCIECCLLVGSVGCGEADSGDSSSPSGGAAGLGGASQSGGSTGSGGSSATGIGASFGGSLGSGGSLQSGGIGSGVGGASGPQSSGSSGTGGATQASGTGGSGGRAGTGGLPATGGALGTGETGPTGGRSGTGGSGDTGGRGGTGGTVETGGRAGIGGTGPTGGRSGTGGAAETGGRAGTGGRAETGGTGPTGGRSGTGGAAETGGDSGTGGVAETGGVLETGGAGPSDACSFTVDSSTSTKIPTVGIVEWSTDLPDPSSAQIVYTLNNAGAGVLNVGGVAPVDLSKENYRTLLLGLKGQSSYTFHVEATSSNGTTCVSEDYDLTTGATSGAPQVTRSASDASAQAKGFITTSGGLNGNSPAFIIDADGAVVWWASAPASCSRAHMDYEGENMWMLALNAQNMGGEMRRVSMDGEDAQNNVSGLSSTHHDFTVLPGGIVAAPSWSGSGMDCESNLIERSPDGTVRTAFRIGSSVYPGGQSEFGVGSNTYHTNSVVYHPGDDSYTVGDRNPNLYVKVTRAGAPVWQLGGNCSAAAAPKCASADWDVNHGHHLVDDNTFLLFANGAFGSSTASLAYEFSLNTSGNAMTATEVHSQAASNNAHSDSLGDVQRLPNGNTLIVFSNNGRIEEYDPSWRLVQTLTASSFGYIDWRETLYGPPQR